MSHQASMLEASFLRCHMNCRALYRCSISPKEHGSQAQGFTSAGLPKVRRGNLIVGLGHGSFQGSGDVRLQSLHARAAWGQRFCVPPSCPLCALIGWKGSAVLDGHDQEDDDDDDNDDGGDVDGDDDDADDDEVDVDVDVDADFDADAGDGHGRGWRRRWWWCGVGGGDPV